MNYRQESISIKEKILQYRRHFHMYPEVSTKEFQTAEYIAKELTNMGIKIIQRGASPQEIGKEIYTKEGKETILKYGDPLPGVVGLMKGDLEGPTVALRADMDALAMEEKNDLPYSSQNKGIMHACGHDAHMAILLGTAQLLARKRKNLKGNVKFIFQPSEEIIGGAVPLIKDGVLKNPDVDVIFGLHMDPSYKVGEVGISYGETMAASDRLIIKIFGKSSHGASPELGTDAIVIAGHILVAFQSLMARMKSPLESAVLSFGTIHGGQQPNSLAEEVMIRGILRTFNPKVRKEIIQNMQQILTGVTQAYGGSFEFTREKSYDSLINDKDSVIFLEETFKDIIGKEKIKVLEKPRTIVEDFAYYLKEVPGAFFFLGSGNPQKDTQHPLHSSNFNIDEDALELGVALMTALTLNYLDKKTL